MREPGKHWSEAIADEVLRVFPDEEIHTCAAGISPSGVVHFGNFRDVMTSFAVAKALQKKGKKVRFLFSWDDFDRFRKVPVGVDESFSQYIGMPLTSVPDPQGEFESYAERFQKEFEQAMKELQIEMEYVYQTKEYASGRYDDAMFHALNKRAEIAEVLLSFMSDKAKAAKEIDESEYKKEYYPLSIYSRFSGKDSTKILDYDGGTKVTYLCLETDKKETVDLSKEHIAKLAWKIDWPMRWVDEHVTFEPGGHDHASPGGSYDTSGTIVKKIFDREPPVFAAYKFVGLQGLKGKMSGSKGQAVSPGELLDIYEPQLLRWLYLRKTPEQPFDLVFDTEIYRQYSEMDREVDALKKDELSPDRAIGIEMSFDGVGEMPENPIPFRHAVAYGQIVQWDTEKMVKLLKDLDLEYAKDSIHLRLKKAKTWLEKYNPDEVIELLDGINTEYKESMDPDAVEHVRTLREKLQDTSLPVDELEVLVYGIPKDPNLDQKGNSPRQRAFFKDVYNLLIGKDTGPRLATFLWAVDRQKVLSLLDI